MFKIVSHSEIETFNVAKKLANFFNKGDIIVLSGNLGAGKTKFVEGFLDFFSMSSEISSPTFTIVNEYVNQSINIYHFDVYRLTDEDEFLAIGGMDYFDNGICLIEWGEKIHPLLPHEYIKINFEKDINQENIRYLEIIPYGKKYEDLLKEVII